MLLPLLLLLLQPLLFFLLLLFVAAANDDLSLATYFIFILGAVDVLLVFRCVFPLLSLGCLVTWLFGAAVRLSAVRLSVQQGVSVCVCVNGSFSVSQSVCQSVGHSVGQSESNGVLCVALVLLLQSVLCVSVVFAICHRC